MGLFKERSLRGEAFNPTPADLASTIADWDPRKDDADKLDIPGPLPFCWAIRPWADSADRQTILELHPGLAWRYKRIFGIIAKAEECKADNTTTAFKFEVLRRLNYRASDTIANPDLMSRLYFAVRDFSPNCLLTDPTGILLGGVDLRDRCRQLQRIRPRRARLLGTLFQIGLGPGIAGRGFHGSPL